MEGYPVAPIYTRDPKFKSSGKSLAITMWYLPFRVTELYQKSA